MLLVCCLCVLLCSCSCGGQALSCVIRIMSSYASSSRRHAVVHVRHMHEWGMALFTTLIWRLQSLLRVVDWGLLHSRLHLFSFRPPFGVSSRYCVILQYNALLLTMSGASHIMRACLCVGVGSSSFFCKKRRKEELAATRTHGWPEHTSSKQASKRRRQNALGMGIETGRLRGIGRGWEGQQKHPQKQSSPTHTKHTPKK